MFDNFICGNKHYMKKFNLTTSLNTALRIFIIFLICLIWSRYFISPLWISLIVTIILTFAIDFFIVYLSQKKQSKQNIQNDENEKINNYANTFVFSNNKIAVSFFLNLAKTKHIATKTTKYVIVQNQNEKIILYPCFLYRPFDCNDLTEIYKSLSIVSLKRIVICTNKVDPQVYDLCNKLPKEVFVLDAKDTFVKLYKEYNIYPPQTKLEQKPQNKYQALAKYALNKKRTKGYFVASLFLIMSSFISPYKIYYLVVSTILLSLTFISLFNPKFNKIEEKNVLTP